MNEAHEHCGSDEWRALMRDFILPWAIGEVDLGDDVLEVGPGYGATTDVLGRQVPRLTAVEIDADLAAMLTERFATVPAVLQPGAALVTSDSLASEGLEAHHDGDIYNPVDPASLARRLATAGFAQVDVQTNEFGWAAVARR